MKKFVIALTVACLSMTFIACGNTSNIGESKNTTVEEEQDTANASTTTTVEETKDLAKANVGDEILFGSYEQDNDTSNGKEDINWIVLEKDHDKILVISKYALDCQPYNNTYEKTTWSTSTLRTWLNDTFLSNAFSADEAAKIVTTNVTAANDGGNTQDKIFLSNLSEAEKYFDSDLERQCSATEYAVAQGACNSDSTGNCCWWLRNSGSQQYYAMITDNDGTTYSFGYSVSDETCGIRPVMWIEI